MTELPPGVTDPAVFERQCRAALEQHLTTPHWADVSPFELLGVTLRGEYPDTAFVIRYRDTRSDRDGVFVTELWPEAEAEWAPEDVAVAVSTLLMEH